MFQKRGQFVSEGFVDWGMSIIVLAKQTALHRVWDMFSMGKVMP